MKLAMNFLFHVNPVNFKLFAALLWIVDAIVCTLIIWKVPYTEIDWSSYMQQVDWYDRGIRNYSYIEGDTGPVVYPAGHMWSYMALSRITDGGKNIRLAQYIFEALYLASLLLVFRIYYLSHRLPPFVLLILSCLSYRIHSIYLLRLFNDPIAMLFFYIALNLWISRRFIVGAIFYSLAVSVKMNILLFAPALFFIFLLNIGYWNTLKAIVMCGIIQIVIGLPFILHDPLSYIQRSFNFGRVFIYEWTVNWRFLSEKVFLDHRFHLLLLVVHLSLLLIAGYVWFRHYGGFLQIIKIVRYRTRMLMGVNEILVALFTANLIGISVARSLHYQFYSWYFHTLPYLLFSGLSFNSDWIFTNKTFEQRPCSPVSALTIIVRCGLLVGIEICWNTYPSTVLSSAMLHCLHVAVFFTLLRDHCTNSLMKRKVT